MHFRRGEIVDLEVSDYAFGGRGIAKIDNEKGRYIVFIANAFPGQLVKVKIDVTRKQHAEAKLLSIIRRSSVEKDSTFQEISGGPYIRVPVEKQEAVKKQSALETFSRLSGIKQIDSLFDCFISSPSHYFYRNKMEYSFSSIQHCVHTEQDIDNAFALGFKRRGTWWKVENLDLPSGLFDEEWETKLKDIRKYLSTTGLRAWHPPKKNGFFRHIIVRKSFTSQQLLVNLVTSSEGVDKFDVKAFGSFLKTTFEGRIAGLQHTINDNVADRSKIENGKNQQIFGEKTLKECLSGLEFQISMESFFQTNPQCAEKLYDKAIDYLFETKYAEDNVLMDLFCGTGTIGQLMSKRDNKVHVIGVDIVDEAIEDAKENAQRNKLENLDFYAKDVGKFLKEHPEYHGKIAGIMLDPPRAGIAPKTLQKVIELGAKTIVYISCNPSTQARDTSLLVDAGYLLEKISLVDQFPHTGHIESIAKFIKS
ncbi:MAG: 23S rRNA (uracil(1939)-C(5))-methyltransferase RlmD [Bacteroidetes bacterium]|nr:23S rRNA (uracil(1939)-C(5))-methyltransferase RlmD [Bacteroidota bacterium]